MWNKIQNTFYKVVRDDLTHRSVVYKTGLNINPTFSLTFNPTFRQTCLSDVQWFTDFARLGRSYMDGNMVAVIRIPKNAQVYSDPHSIKADRFIVDRFEPIGPYWADQTFCLDAVKRCGLALRYIENQTPELCSEAVRRTGIALKYVKEQTPELCLAAVKQNGNSILYVKDQTPEICLAAVKQNGHALLHVKEQTPEICLAAVKQDADALSYVKAKTHELRQAAAKQHSWMLYEDLIL